MELKRKSPLQLQALEKFYAEHRYPSHNAIQGLASILGLTYKQVCGWFVSKRRRDKGRDVLHPYPSNTLTDHETRYTFSVSSADRSNTTSSSRYDKLTQFRDRQMKKRKNQILLQDLLTPGYILGKTFRKDGPPLGVEFDTLPSMTSPVCKDSRKSISSCQENQKAKKRRQNCVENASTKKHGIGKGLMTVWRAVNPNGGDLPTDINFFDRQINDAHPVSTPDSQKFRQSKNRRQTIPLMTRLRKRALNVRKPFVKSREVGSKRGTIQMEPRKEKCELALEGVLFLERLKQFEVLVDDEELELRELQAGPNPTSCSDHCFANGLDGCLLCKDLLPKFPPDVVKMKPPFTMQPWYSSLESVKKLFKAFHFLYTYCVNIDICPFTLDEFAQAFHEKDSLLLGKIHVALLKFLICNVETEMSSEFLPHSSISCKFLALLHSVENQKSIVEFWKNSLNPLTWSEILRQILVAAGYGSKQGALRREGINKEMSLMLKYGLRPRTLKGELFRLLSEQGNRGMAVSDLAKSSQIAELNLASTTDRLELSICSTLSSDITLFEKISPSTYRLRINASIASSGYQSDMDSGSVHDDFDDDGTSNSSDSEYDSSSARKSKQNNYQKSKSNSLIVYNEIDESHQGEVWMLGLMEDEYSDLNIEEKLNALVALIDLLSAGSSIRREDPSRITEESAPRIHHYGSGAKIKRSSSNQNNLPRPSWDYIGQTNNAKEIQRSSGFFPVDSSVSILDGKDQFPRKDKDVNESGFEVYLHPMQSIFLGSDRRYNSYWLFLGPCDAHDPGHKRVYFESSEDGHWEVIDTQEALHSLLSVLDDRGKREAFLIESLEKRELFLCKEMSRVISNDAEIRNLTRSSQSGLEIVREDSSSPVSDVDNSLNQSLITNSSLPQCGAIVLEAGKNGDLENRNWSHLQEFDAWIWNSFYCNLNAVRYSKKSYFESLTRCETCHDLFWRDEKHCRICHMTFELDFDLEERYTIHSATCRTKGDSGMFLKHKILSSQLQSLKAAVHAIESAMPEDGLVGAWRISAHRLWVKRLRRTSSLAELLQVVADFVAALNEDWLCKCITAEGSRTFMEDIVTCFPSMPQTSSALAVWLLKLDELICPYLEKVQRQKKQAGPKVHMLDYSSGKHQN
ncbi:hypothetical protein K2173_000599 [Erythroxylum novogranatense]|uniref:Homeobox-DDT domain protein RLT3 n=1 Tax=Erythroxylum novogranatense TaxID=1862640 RepID=A0AAV8S7L9_9ROSI|nr:hypothetical protein K2173_000599 [Erythroxylum novogranatense]